MIIPSKRVSVAFLAMALSCSVAGLACAPRHSYRVYDPYYTDYHVWNHDEVVYYRQWSRETHHRDRDFRKLPPAEQKEYWTWRHNHGDHDRDRDRHDRDNDHHNN
jgi:hypothetical protein